MNIKNNKYFKVALPYLISISIAILIYGVMVYFFHPVFISGHSMEPTLQDGKLVSTSTNFSPQELQRGNIIIFKKNHIKYVKRIIALPGETILIKDGNVFINGNPLDDFTFDSIEDGGIVEDSSLTLNSDEYFCLGDNRNASEDCRNLGPVTFDEIKNKVNY